MNNRKDGMSGLFSVLSNWKDAVYIPPKTTQAFQQGKSNTRIMFQVHLFLGKEIHNRR